MKHSIFQNYLNWYRHYHYGTVMVSNLGIWESFCRAVKWAWRQR